MIIDRIENITKGILNELNINKVKDIKLNKVAKHLGVELIEKDMESNISGFFVFKDQKAYIFYNKKDTNNKARQRFTIAHELGHFVLHKDMPISITKSATVLFRDEKTSSGEYKKEREANSFAASLLMSKGFIEYEIEKSPDDTKNILEYLAELFKVSEQAMSFRLANLDYSMKGGY